MVVDGEKSGLFGNRELAATNSKIKFGEIPN